MSQYPIQFYDHNEVQCAYTLLSLEKSQLIQNWHTEDIMPNLYFRTALCQEVQKYIQSKYHCLQVDTEKLSVQIEHYHYVASPTLEDYLDATKLVKRIIVFANSLEISIINQNVFL